MTCDAKTLLSLRKQVAESFPLVLRPFSPLAARRHRRIVGAVQIQTACTHSDLIRRHIRDLWLAKCPYPLLVPSPNRRIANRLSSYNKRREKGDVSSRWICKRREIQKL